MKEFAQAILILVAASLGGFALWVVLTWLGIIGQPLAQKASQADFQTRQGDQKALIEAVAGLCNPEFVIHQPGFRATIEATLLKDRTLVNDLSDANKKVIAKVQSGSKTPCE
jgi:hypothetical protein